MVPPGFVRYRWQSKLGGGGLDWVTAPDVTTPFLFCTVKGLLIATNTTYPWLDQEQTFWVTMDASNIEVKMGSERGFAYVFAAVFTIIALFPVWHGGPVRLWALAIAAAILIVGFVRPAWLAVPNKIWFKFGLLLGAIVAPIVMALVFLVVITPFGLVRQRIGKNPMAPAPDKDAKSYWKTRETPLQSFKRQF
ncbi:SxtJ family membrane protein [Roseovarius aestuarii]|nr:SxtJ family membrane protein [Roseovarius aestuarii]